MALDSPCYESYQRGHSKECNKVAGKYGYGLKIEIYTYSWKIYYFLLIQNLEISKWKLSEYAFALMSNDFSLIVLDLFASRINSQLHVYVFEIRIHTISGLGAKLIEAYRSWWVDF